MGGVVRPRAKSTVGTIRFEFSRVFLGIVDIGIRNLEHSLPEHVRDASPYLLADARVWCDDAVRRRMCAALPGLTDERTRLVAGGEAVKSFTEWQATLEWMQAARMRRTDLLIVLGGGSVTDMGGFAASAYLRGVPYVNVPTTLVAQADAAIGGKVAINTPAAKNSVGAFFHPSAVVVDVSLLDTLTERDVRSGLAECVKVSAAQPTGELFRYIAESSAKILSGDSTARLRVVESAIAEKLDLLTPDPFETDLARVLNFGHTIGHALEAADNYVNWRHGEAVAIGMMTACRAARILGFATKGTYDAFRTVLADLGLPLTVPSALIPRVVACLDEIRKVRGGRLHYVVPTGVGTLTVLDEVDVSLLIEAMRGRVI
jgi:3-dehydroquinate synthase